MTRIISTNITSPLGMTTELNYQAVKAGRSALMRYDNRWGLQEPFAASLFTDEQIVSMMVEGYSRFESVVLHSVREALSHTSIDVTSERVVFILSTTKGNVELLGDNDCHERLYPGGAAKRIAHQLCINSEPIVVCNACISGVSAQILAQRLIDAGMYDYAIVAGAEIQSKFIVSGFQAFRAVTDEICRPFDIERLGLNLGDGAATIVFGHEGRWAISNGAIRNDAYHLSAPHPQGDGYLNALNEVLSPSDSLATISVHGTATMYNDQMESVAIQRAGLSDIPLTSLKGYYGHTMGAAGLIETIITLRATDDGIILPARGFEEIGVSGKVNISAEQRTTDKHTIIKMLSGFGGCNGAIRYTDLSSEDFLPTLSTSSAYESHKSSSPWGRLGGAPHTVRITPQGAWVDGAQLGTTATGRALLKELYKTHVNDYPKFYKMDMLTRLTFIATELLLDAEGGTQVAEGEMDDSRALILFNRSSSIVADRQYWDTIKDDENYYPSPAAFLYTLPNLTTGEVAIRNHYTGETSFYILSEKNESLMNDIINVSFADRKTTSVIGGWIECENDETFEAEISLIYI